MRISSITRTRKPKQFNFSTRYYNQEQEEFQARVAETEARITGKSDYKGTASITGFKNKWKSNQKTQSFEKKSNVRLLVIIAILLLASYWILYS